jgi:gentisate 1,2-dioxygenase
MSDQVTAIANSSNLEALRGALDPLDFMAGWNKHEPSLWREPRTAYTPMHWKYAEAKVGLDVAGKLINAEQAERRNLFMVNPVPGNHYDTLRTIVSAYQMILPGETARTHRHSPHALRLVMDVADDCYTVVDGARIDMKPGDVLLTPGMCWHGHGNEGARPGYWIDFLDVPIVHLIEPMFLDHWDGLQPIEQKTRDSEFVFPLDQTLEKLKSTTPDEYGRVRVRLGEANMPSLGLYMNQLTAGAWTKPLRSTENQVFAVVSGSGESHIGEKHFQWSRGDVFVSPTWHKVSHRASEDAIIFNVSDDAMQSKLGYLRVEAAANG